MKAATKVTLRRTARDHQAEALCAVRVQTPEIDELPAVQTRPALTAVDVRFEGQQEPLSCAEQRRQAADKWWRDACLALSDWGEKHYH